MSNSAVDSKVQYKFT